MSMRRKLSMLLAIFMLLATLPAMASNDSGTRYTMPVEGTLLQNSSDRGIKPADGVMDVNPIIEGISSTTGLPLSGLDRYMPMLVQISTGADTKLGMAGVGTRAPWSAQYADIVYEGILYRTGQTRLTFLFSDSFAEGSPVNVGPVRSARIGHVLLRQEWQGGIIHAGGPRTKNNNITAKYTELGADELGVVFDLTHDGTLNDYWERVPNLVSDESASASLIALRNMIPQSTIATEHPFLFSDISMYTEGYDFAYSINLDWGHKAYVSHLYYDEANNVYNRYVGSYPFKTYTDAYDRNTENMLQMSFSNVIIQRVDYEYANGDSKMPVMQSVGKGNADIFIGGRYIPGYWKRDNVDSATVYMDDKGNEIVLIPGKTYIADMPPERVLTYQADNFQP